MNRKERSFYKYIGESLQIARKAAGKNQEEIAQLIGVTRTSITNMEAGRQSISLYQCALLAQELPLFARDLKVGADISFLKIKFNGLFELLER